MAKGRAGVATGGQREVEAPGAAAAVAVPRREREQAQAPPAAGSVLSLQRSAGNRATTMLVQRKEAPGAGGGGKAGIDPAAEALLKSTLEGYVGSLLEKGFPPAKVIILATKLGGAFANGVGEALTDVRARLGTQYDSDIDGSADRGDGLSEKQVAQLQNVRRWQANSVGELSGILEKGMISLGKQAVEELASEVVGMAFDKGLEKLTDAMSTKVTHFVLDRATGEFVDASYLARAPIGQVRAVAEAIGSEVSKAFLQACGSAVAAAGWDRAAAVAAGMEGGMSKADAEKMADEALKAQVRSDDLSASVEEKFGEVSAKRMWLLDASYAQADRKTFLATYPELVKVAGELDALWFWQRDARAAKKEQLRELYTKALVALQNLNRSDRTSSFEAELAVLRSRYEKAAY